MKIKYLYYKPTEGNGLGLATVYRKQVGQSSLEFPSYRYWNESHYSMPNKNLKRISFKEARTIRYWAD